MYLSELWRPSLAGHRHLRSANRGQLVVPRYRLTTAGRRAFSCAGPSAWNSLPEYLTVDRLTLDYFKQSLKCFLFARYWHSTWSALRICYYSALYKCTLNNSNNNNNNNNHIKQRWETIHGHMNEKGRCWGVVYRSQWDDQRPSMTAVDYRRYPLRWAACSRRASHNRCWPSAAVVLYSHVPASLQPSVGSRRLTATTINSYLVSLLVPPLLQPHNNHHHHHHHHMTC